MKPTGDYIRVINRGSAGTFQVADEMLRLARIGADSIREPLSSLSWANLDDFLRRHWCYMEDGADETVRSIAEMCRDYRINGVFIGDCDDAAVLCAAISLERRLSAQLVLARHAGEPFHSHVFVELALMMPGSCRLDPTAPANANYSGWELTRIQIL